MDLCALIIISVPHHHPSHHISIHTITCVGVCISSFHLLNTHDNTAVLVTPNFCFPNYVCYSCISVEKESRWISAFIITPISPWALIKSQPVWCCSFSPPFSEYDSSQGPDKKRTVYQMALSMKSLSPLLTFCKKGVFEPWGSLQSSFLCSLLYFLLPLTTSLRLCSALPVFGLCFLDKLDEILAAAQHTITSDNQGQRGHGGKRDRSKSIVPNSTEVQLGIGRKWWLLQ